MSDALIGVIATTILVVGGGLIAYLKHLQDRVDRRQTEAIERREKREEQRLKLSNGKLKAEDAAWKHMQEALTVQASRLDDQGERIGDLEKRIKCCEDERDLLLERNALLDQERETLLELLAHKENKK